MLLPKKRRSLEFQVISGLGGAKTCGSEIQTSRPFFN